MVAGTRASLSEFEIWLACAEIVNSNNLFVDDAIYNFSSCISLRTAIEKGDEPKEKRQICARCDSKAKRNQWIEYGGACFKFNLLALDRLTHHKCRNVELSSDTNAEWNFIWNIYTFGSSNIRTYVVSSKCVCRSGNCFPILFSVFFLCDYVGYDSFAHVMVVAVVMHIAIRTFENIINSDK